MSTLTAPLFALLAAASLLAGCDERDVSASAPSDLDEIENFAVYFAGDRLDTLSTFDLAILDADAFPAETARSLHEGGTLPVAYLNLGEAETYRWFYDQVEEDWILGANPDWDDHYYVDARAEGWQNLLLDTVIPRIVEKGYEGLFFDMVDTAMPGLHPETRPGMVRLIERIHERYPDLRLVMNNGLFFADEVAPLIDAVAVEGTFTRYDFDAQTYRRTDEAAREARVEQLNQLQEQHDLTILVIGYAAPGDQATRRYVRQQARAEGFIPFVSTLALDTIGADGAADGAADATGAPSTDGTAP